MKAYAIVLDNVDVSEKGFAELVKSSQAVGNTFTVEKFSATTPEQVPQTLSEENVHWNYPLNGAPVLDIQSGLVKTPYNGADPNKRIACALSHYKVWKLAQEEAILVLEHDALFKSKIDFDINETGFDILGLNYPIGATRKAYLFHETVQYTQRKYQVAPYVDEKNIPQGIAGNSAYIITPAGAKKMLSLVDHYGLWPNDALMCLQLFGPKLGVTRQYYTITQGLPSTTTL